MFMHPEQQNLQSDIVNIIIYKYFAGAMWLGLAVYWSFDARPFVWGRLAIIIPFLLMSLFHFSLALVRVRNGALHYRRYLKWIAVQKSEIAKSGIFFAFGYFRFHRFVFPWGRIYFIPDQESGARSSIRGDRGVFRLLRDWTSDQ